MDATHLKPEDAEGEPGVTARVVRPDDVLHLGAVGGDGAAGADGLAGDAPRLPREQADLSLRLHQVDIHQVGIDGGGDAVGELVHDAPLAGAPFLPQLARHLLQHVPLVRVEGELGEGEGGPVATTYPPPGEAGAAERRLHLLLEGLGPLPGPPAAGRPSRGSTAPPTCAGSPGPPTPAQTSPRAPAGRRGGP